MAKVPVAPIGAPLDASLDDASASRNREAMAERDTLLTERRDQVAAGWGSEYQERVRSKGKLPTRERLEQLADPGTDLFEVGTFCNWGRKFGKQESPAAGVVTVFARRPADVQAIAS